MIIKTKYWVRRIFTIYYVLKHLFDYSSIRDYS